MAGGRGVELLGERIAASVERARAVPGLAVHAVQVSEAFGRLVQATREAWSGEDPAATLANAVPYLQAFGHVVVAWIWLDVATRSLEIDPGLGEMATQGRLGAARYFFGYELPKIDAWLAVVARRDRTCADLAVGAF